MQWWMQPNLAFVIRSLSSPQIGGMSAIPTQRWSQHEEGGQEEGMSHSLAGFALAAKVAMNGFPARPPW